jgi:hypothetical protein
MRIGVLFMMTEGERSNEQRESRNSGKRKIKNKIWDAERYTQTKTR